LDIRRANEDVEGGSLMPSSPDDATDAYCRRQVSGRRLVATDEVLAALG